MAYFSDIYSNLTRILQRIAGLSGQFRVKGGVAAIRSAGFEPARELSVC